ncbi:hypothetical protein GC176_23435 [bacterium]|nr:hypothetical protein [bacterium]
MKQVFGLIALLCSLCLATGCGSTVDDHPVEVTPVTPPAKVMLEQVAEAGVLGSDAMSIREALEQMKASGDAAKADELLSDLDELEKTSGEAQIKQKAKAMAAKL